MSQEINSKYRDVLIPFQGAKTRSASTTVRCGRRLTYSHNKPGPELWRQRQKDNTFAMSYLHILLSVLLQHIGVYCLWLKILDVILTYIFIIKLVKMTINKNNTLAPG